MFNKVILIGRATRDPELRYTPAGNAVCTYHIAVDRPFTNSRGEREADFITIVAWSKLAEHLANYLRKGKLHAVEGRIQTRNYENNDGRRVYVTEVVAENVRIIEWPERNNTQDGGIRRSAPETAPPETDYYGGYKDDARATDFYGYDKGDTQPLDISDDDLPF